MKTERLEAADIAQLYKLWNEYSAAINSEDAERWIELWCENGIKMLADAPPRIGKAQIRNFIQSQFDLLQINLSLNLEVIRVIGDQAYTHGTFQSVETLKEGMGETPIQRSGKFMTVLEKQADGCWKILVDCFNYSVGEDGDKFNSDL